MANAIISYKNKKTCFYLFFSGLKYFVYVLLHSHMRLGDTSGVTEIDHGDTRLETSCQFNNFSYGFFVFFLYFVFPDICV